MEVYPFWVEKRLPDRLKEEYPDRVVKLDFFDDFVRNFYRTASPWLKLKVKPFKELRTERNLFFAQQRAFEIG